MTDVDDIQMKMSDAIASALQEEGDFILKYVAVIEVMDKDGEHCLWTVTSPGITGWDISGLLGYATSAHENQLMLFAFASAQRDDNDEE